MTKALVGWNNWEEPDEHLDEYPLYKFTFQSHEEKRPLGYSLYSLIYLTKNTFKSFYSSTMEFLIWVFSWIPNSNAYNKWKQN